jgi:hypothetical protein
VRLGTVLVLAVSSTLAARADTLFAYEGFSYTAGSSLDGQNGGSGWAGAWTTPGGLDATITAQSLSFGDLGGAGGAATTAGFQPPNQGSSVAFWLRNLAAPLGADGTTAYISFLLQPDAGSGFYGGVNFGNVFIGVSGNQSDYGLEGPTNDLSLSNVAVVQGQTVLLVLEAQFQAGNDLLSLFVNPTPGQAQPATPSATKSDLDVGTVNSVVINNYGGYTTDEIRIGSTFASVTSVPEPAFGWVLVAGLACMAGLNWRFRSDS